MSKLLLKTIALKPKNFRTQTFQKCISSLIVSKGYINGQWVEAISGKKFEVENPADRKVIASVPNMDEDDAEIAICAAREAFCSSSWGGINVNSRYLMLRSWTRLIKGHANRLAQLITTETGKPILQSKGEVEYSLGALEAYAKDSIFLNKDVTVGNGSIGVFLIRQPVGVVSLLTSWDFPMALFARKAGAALACGCTLVCKPSKNAPLTILALCKLADKIGFPPGVINVVTTKQQRKVGAVFCKSPDVAAVTFAGSSKTCREIYERYGNTLKRFNLEMYTDATFIAFETANIDMAVKGALRAKFHNNGYMSVSAGRFFVHEAIYYQFIDKLKSRLSKLRVGNGIKPDVRIGPLINEEILYEITKMVEDAREQNAHVAWGGHLCPEIGKLFYAPTIVIDVEPSMLLYSEEVPGPVASVIRFSSEKDLLGHASSSVKPPAAIFYGHDYREVFSVCSKLDVTLIGVNENIIAAGDVPFTGGMKYSDRLVLGLSEFLVRKYISVGNTLAPRKRKKEKEPQKSKSVK